MDNTNLKQRIGRFTMSGDMHDDDNLALVGEIFSHMKIVPVRVEYMWHNSEFKYMGVSPLFKEIDEGMVAPMYDIVVETDEESNVIKVTANEIK